MLGCIQALVDVLAITNPVAFGRANRVKRLAMEFAEKVDCSGFWQLEAAAMLSQIGYVSLPPELCEKLYYGNKLTPEEATLAEGVPQIAINLLEHIPRLEPVIQILMALQWRDDAIMRLGDGTIGLGTRILALVLEYDGLVAQGANPAAAMQKLRERVSRYGADLLEKFSAHDRWCATEERAAHDAAARGRCRHDHDAGCANGGRHPPRPARTCRSIRRSSSACAASGRVCWPKKSRCWSRRPRPRQSAEPQLS